MFQIGSTTLFELGIDAKQDAWLVILVSMIAASLLLSLFFLIQLRKPEHNLIQLLIEFFGSFLGRLAAFAYVMYFIYESMRNVRDFGELTIMTFLSQTPISLIMLVMVLLSSYVVAKGIEVFFRTAEFMLPGVLLFYTLLIVMYFSSGIVRLDRLFPVLENGIGPVLKSVIQDVIWFPFGQMVLFLVYWSYLTDKGVMIKTSVRAYMVSGTIMMVINIINIAVLGTPYTSISTVPFLQSVQLIQIADFLERFDAFVILLLYIGIFVKSTLWYLAAALGLGQLLNIDYRKLFIPIGGTIYFASFLEPNWTYHLWLGKIVAYKFMVNPIFILIIPALLFLLMLVKGRVSSSSGRDRT